MLRFAKEPASAPRSRDRLATGKLPGTNNPSVRALLLETGKQFLHQPPVSADFLNLVAE